MRGLSDTFMQDLLSGELHSFLEAVQRDHTLCLEIRDNYLNIYYRGGSILKIQPAESTYGISFDLNYTDKYRVQLSQLTATDHGGWLQSIPLLKAEMDAWFVAQSLNAEREFQQVILRENNIGGIANDTDYYIADLEYASSENRSRFDMMGVKWLSTTPDRKNRNNVKLTFIEVKYGDKSLTGKSSMQEHMRDMLSFLSDEQKVASIYRDTETVFNQKIQLGLVHNISESVTLNPRNDLPEFILLCANHKPASTVLMRELQAVCASPEYAQLKELCQVKIARSSLMGYGLYACCMEPLETFVGAN